MRARLTIHKGEDVGKSWTIEREVTIGRSHESKVRLRDRGVSANHARIFYDEKAGCFMLEDLKSSNGTVLGGATVRRPEKLLALDIIGFARTVSAVFQVLPDAPAGAGAPAPQS